MFSQILVAFILGYSHLGLADSSDNPLATNENILENARPGEEER